MKKIVLFVCTLILTLFSSAQQAERIKIEVAPNGRDLKIYPLPAKEGSPVLFINQYGMPGFEIEGESRFEWSEYHDATEGKPESINATKITYYNNLDHDGFLASVESIELEYYDRLPGEAHSTKLRYINTIEITYYDIMQGPPKQGKIKSIGNIQLDYAYGFDNEGKLTRAGNYRIFYHQEDNRSGKSGKPDTIEGNDERLQLILTTLL
ncbi:MAG: hypothetical protein EOL88_00965 [Bacteroidia bacterium]|nr:hypothetical protein [Bacteroidia bacterium]